MKKNSSASVMETESGSALTTGEKVMRYWAHNWQLWLMLLPGIIYIFVFCYVPMYGVQLAFRDYSFASGITGGKWEGFKYFKQYIMLPFINLIGSFYLLVSHSLVYCTSLVKKLSGVRIPLQALYFSKTIIGLI